MPSPPPNIRRHFLPWDRPLLQQAAGYLAAGWNGAGPLDLSRALVVVPTRQSGRRLREALAELAAQHGQAAFPPRVMTPDMLVAPEASPGLASRAESLLAWAQVFRELDLDAFRDVFPVDPPARTFSWSMRAARQFAELQKTLAESRLRLADVAGKIGADNPEVERWSRIGELEARYIKGLAAMGRRDPEEARIDPESVRRLQGVDRIVVLAVTDPVPLSLSVLKDHSNAIPLDVVVFAPESEADAFDEWGRPIESAWENRKLDLADFERCVRVCTDSEAQADRVAEIARGYEVPDGMLGVGAADSEVLPFIESALARDGIACFDPRERPRRGEAIYQLLSGFAALAGKPAFGTVEALARCPDFLDYLAATLGGPFTVDSWLAGLDELHARHLPEDLSSARIHAAALRGFPCLATALDLVEQVRAALVAGGFAAGGSEVLTRVFGARRLELDRDPDERFAESAAAWMDIVRECASAREHFPGLAEADLWNLALDLFAGSGRVEDKPDGALELQGWLELLFEDAPHLVVAGCNDGSLPGDVTGDPFLPEGMRAMLGIGGNGARLARDAYLLQALAACRSRGGRIELLVGKVTGEGDPLRPSRLLLRCADPDLPGRVEFLFRPVEKARPSPPWGRAWVLSPEIKEERRLERLKVTAFRDYLHCPFRFYLSHVMGIVPFDPQKMELNGADFGKLCHHALEAMGGERGLRDCTDAGTLRSFLVSRLDGFARELFGARLPAPLIVQLESARQRLARAAEVQAGQRAQGWVIEETEKDFEIRIGGLDVMAKVDRIDRHERTGERRVLDYKTSDEAKAPRKVHARASRAGEEAPEYARFQVDGKPMVWEDLQLPIYREALKGERHLPDAPSLTLGYFNLPKATGETGLELWEDYTAGLHAEAMRCAERVAAGVTGGVFWPPAKASRSDAYAGFAGLFHHGAPESVDPRFAEEARLR